MIRNGSLNDSSPQNPPHFPQLKTTLNNFIEVIDARLGTARFGGRRCGSEPNMERDGRIGGRNSGYHIWLAVQADFRSSNPKTSVLKLR